jgi:preprotein translocase subunit SecG
MVRLCVILAGIVVGLTIMSPIAGWPQVIGGAIAALLTGQALWQNRSPRNILEKLCLVLAMFWFGIATQAVFHNLQLPLYPPITDQRGYWSACLRALIPTLPCLLLFLSSRLLATNDVKLIGDRVYNLVLSCLYCDDPFFNGTAHNPIIT